MLSVPRVVVSVQLTKLGLILCRGQVVTPLQVHQNISVTMFHLSMTHGTEEILGVNFTITILSLKSVLNPLHQQAYCGCVRVWGWEEL